MLKAMVSIILFMAEQYKYEKITELIIGAAMEVHSILGCGFQEKIYQRALIIELGLRNLKVASEYDLPINYKSKLIGKRVADLFVENIIPVELKAIKALEPVDLVQAINQLEAGNIEIGLLFNFGGKRLEHRRVYNSKFKENL